MVPFPFYEAQVLDLRKLLEFYYFQLSIELLFFNITYISLLSSLGHWFFFSLCAVSLLNLANTDIKKIFYLLWSWHTLYFWVLMLSFSVKTLLLIKQYIYRNNWYFAFLTEWVFCPCLQRKKVMLREISCIGSTRGWEQEPELIQITSLQALCFSITLAGHVFTKFKGSVLVGIRNPWMISLRSQSQWKSWFSL